MTASGIKPEQKPELLKQPSGRPRGRQEVAEGHFGLVVAPKLAGRKKATPVNQDPQVVGPTAAQIDLVRKIRQDWGDTLEKNLHVGACLIELRLPKRVWQLNLLNLPMSYSWAKRLMKVAGDKRIPSHIDRMPGARGTLHKISTLSNREFEKALSEGIINPACTRQDVVDFQRYQKGTSANLRVTVSFEVSGGAGRPEHEATAELEDLLRSIKKMIGSDFPSVEMKRRMYVRPLKDSPPQRGR